MSNQNQVQLKDADSTLCSVTLPLVCTDTHPSCELLGDLSKFRECRGDRDRERGRSYRPTNLLHLIRSCVRPAEGLLGSSVNLLEFRTPSDGSVARGCVDDGITPSLFFLIRSSIPSAHRPSKLAIGSRSGSGGAGAFGGGGASPGRLRRTADVWPM